MATQKLSGAAFVQRGYGQVEPNHLSAQFTGQIYAQLPADPSIAVLENGMFAKYDYAHGVVTLGEATVNVAANATNGKEDSVGEWMLVLNEVNLYRDRETFEDFAMIRDFYNTRIYSPLGQHNSTINTVMNYGDYTDEDDNKVSGEAFREGTQTGYTTGVPDFNYWETMPAGATMTPRLFKTNIGDIFTTNCVNESTLAVGDILVPTKGTGYLNKKASPAATDMQWQVVKVYTLANNMPAVKLQRIA